MQKTQTYIFVLVFVLALLGALAGWYFLPTTNEPHGDQGPNQTSTTTNPAADTSSDWQQYEASVSNNVSFDMKYPPRAVVSAVRDTIYELKYIGLASEPNTEITDGYYLSLQFVGDADLTTYAANEPVVGEITDTTFNDRPAVRYQTESALGNRIVNHLVIGLGDAQLGVVDVAYAVYGTATAAYEAEVQRVISSLQLSVAAVRAATSSDEHIRVTAPAVGATVTNPITLSGEARGTWLFEASAPVVVVDWDGRIIGESYISADGDWMTEDFVPFSGTVNFALPTSTPYQRGTVIFQKANPSGLPEHDAAVEVPVRFE